jgi:hypothetical protein
MLVQKNHRPLHMCSIQLTMRVIKNSHSVVGTQMTTVAFKISLQLAHKPSEAGVAQLRADVKRYLSHMLDVAQIDGAEIEKSDVFIVPPRRKAGPSGVTRSAQGLGRDCI